MPEPLGDTLDWTFERLVKLDGRKRRVRETLHLTYCADGWDESRGRVTCQTIIGPSRWAMDPFGPRPRGGRSGIDRDGFAAFHKDNPVVWRIDFTQGRTYWDHWYCDAELPDEFDALLAEVGANEQIVAQEGR